LYREGKILTKSSPLRLKVATSRPKDILEQRWPRRKGFDLKIMNYVKNIIDSVRTKGDAALVEFTNKFDGVRLSKTSLRASESEIQEAYTYVSNSQIAAIKRSKTRLESLAERFLKQINFEFQFKNVVGYSRTYPLRSIGCYVPGGEATYPSSLIMMAAPAKVAGVDRVVVCTPPRAKAQINPLTLVAADICGVNEVYKVGGVQAVAALAFGTQSIQSVEKVFGPGNRYVMAAKALISMDVPIDIPAGPSEVLIFADDSANPKFAALDMISQVEHGMDGISILVTPSGELAKKVAKCIEKKLFQVPRGEIIADILSKNGLIYVCDSLRAGISFVNEFAPEHLQIMVEKPMEIAARITSAGVILIGSYSPVSASDYCLGVNHVLPTGGFGRVFSGLSVFDFVRRMNIVECSKKGLESISDTIGIFAEAEGLLNHKLAVEGRFQ
jgi:histidinol dehydrogenase